MRIQADGSPVTLRPELRRFGLTTFRERMILMPSCNPCEADGYPGIKAERLIGYARVPMCGSCWPMADLRLRIESSVAIDDQGNSIEAIKPVATATSEKESAMKKRVKVDVKELARLHAEGSNDYEIARAIGCSAGAVLAKRRKLGLAANRKHAEKRARENGLGSVDLPVKKKPVKVERANDPEIVVEVKVNPERLCDAMWNKLSLSMKSALLLKAIEELGVIPL
jgi:hypothetical protein